MKGLFLDTATQIARHWHADSERQEIDQQLKGFSLYCSEYVKCQYQATLLNSMILLYNLLLRYRDLRRALREANRYSNSKVAGGRLTPGVQSRIRDIGLWMLEMSSYEEQSCYLEDLIEQAWETFFMDNIEEPLVDETSCLYAKDLPKKGISGAYESLHHTCTQKKPHDCNIDTFWQNHRIQLEILAKLDIDSIQAESKDVKELTAIKQATSSVLSGKSPQGRCCTVTLSDAIICLESMHCPEKCAVHSTNKKHFRLLCEVFGIESKP